MFHRWNPCSENSRYCHSRVSDIIWSSRGLSLSSDEPDQIIPLRRSTFSSAVYFPAGHDLTAVPQLPSIVPGFEVPHLSRFFLSPSSLLVLLLQIQSLLLALCFPCSLIRNLSTHSHQCQPQLPVHLLISLIVKSVLHHIPLRPLCCLPLSISLLRIKWLR